MRYSRTSSAALIVNGAFSALAPMVILIVAYAIAGILPFGDKLLLFAQNSAWFESLAHYHAAITGEESVFYSLSSGLGADFYSTFSEGFGNPFWLLTGLYDAEALHGSVPVVLMIQSAAAGLFSYFMFSMLCREQNLAAVVFSAAYSGGSLFALGFLAPQFSGAAVFLPLVGAGILLLCERGSLLLVFISMVLFLISAPNLWPCLIIFSIAFFVWGMLVCGDRAQMGIRTALLIVSIGLSLGSCMVIMLPPLISEIELGAAVPAVSQIDSASVRAVISALFPGGYMGGETAPLIFSTSLVLIMLPCYLFNPNIGLGERQVSGVSMLMLLLSMAVPTLGWVWLCGSRSTGVVVGLGCFFCLFACACGIRSLSEAANGSVRMMVLSWFAVIMLFFASVALRWGDAPIELLIFSAAALTLFAAITLVVLSNKRITAAFCVVMLLCVCCECVLGAVYSISNADRKLELATTEEYAVQQQRGFWIDSTIASSEEGAASPFFRIRGAETDGNFSIGDAPGATPRSEALLDALGIKNGEGYTPFTDALFGVRYIVTDPSRSEFRYSLVGEDEQDKIYINKAAFSLGITVPESLAYLNTFSADPFTAQNELASAMAAAPRNLFDRAEITGITGIGTTVSETLSGMEIIRYEQSGYVRFSVLAPADGLMYMYIGSSSEEREAVQAGLTLTELMPGAISQLGYVNRGQTVTVTMTVSPERMAIDGIYFAVLDNTLCTAALEEFSACQATRLGVDGSHIRGSIVAQAGQIYLTSIPYMSGWRAMVDGYDVDTFAAAGALLAIEMPEGEHSFELWYEPVYYTASLVISLVAFAVGMVYSCAAEVLRRRKEAADEMRLALTAEEEALAEGIYDSGGYIDDQLMDEALGYPVTAPEFSIDYSAPVFAPQEYTEGAVFQPVMPDFSDYTAPGQGYIPPEYGAAPMYQSPVMPDYMGEYYDQYNGFVDFQPVETLDLDEED